MKVLVTGAAGFIGYHLSLRLLDRGDEVIGVDNLNDYYSVQLKHDRLKDLGVNARTGQSASPRMTFYKANIANGKHMRMTLISGMR